MPTQDPTQGEADNSSQIWGVSLWCKTKENHAGIQVFSFIHCGCSALDQRKVTEVVITPSEGLKDPGAGGRKLLEKQRGTRTTGRVSTIS